MFWHQWTKTWKPRFTRTKVKKITCSLRRLLKRRGLYVNDQTGMCGVVFVMPVHLHHEIITYLFRSNYTTARSNKLTAYFAAAQRRNVHTLQVQGGIWERLVRNKGNEKFWLGCCNFTCSADSNQSGRATLVSTSMVQAQSVANWPCNVALFIFAIVFSTFFPLVVAASYVSVLPIYICTYVCIRLTKFL